MQLWVIADFSDPAPLQHSNEVHFEGDHGLEFDHDNPTLGGEEIHPSSPNYNINASPKKWLPITILSFWGLYN